MRPPLLRSHAHITRLTTRLRTTFTLRSTAWTISRRAGHDLTRSARRTLYTSFLLRYLRLTSCSILEHGKNVFSALRHSQLRDARLSLAERPSCKFLRTYLPLCPRRDFVTSEIHDPAILFESTSRALAREAPSPPGRPSNPPTLSPTGARNTPSAP